MDRLLQRHARRWGVGAASGESEGGDGVSTTTGDAHLDADEMNAYAEGALPPATRARYTSHLADCDSCRAVVIDLTLAAQVAAEESRRDEHESASTSKSWWSAIAAALFAPPVLRYAVPAVLLLGVIVVALVATRDRSEPQFVAQKEESKYDSAASESAPTESSTAQSQPTQPNESAGVANKPATPTGKTEADTPAKDARLDGTLQANTNADRTSAAPTTEPKPDLSAAEANPRERNERGVNDGIYAKEPKDAPPPPAASRPASPVAGSSIEEEKQNREQTTADTSDSKKKASELGRVSSSKAGEAEDKPSNKPLATDESASRQSGAGQAGARTRARRSANRGADDNDRSDNSTETRSVAGRRFRRQGDAWVDTAYSSSRSTINVARGSDQYRALAADEPGIRSIAEQLGGVVIVVLKGKAYRIY